MVVFKLNINLTNEHKYFNFTEIIIIIFCYCLLMCFYKIKKKNPVTLVTRLKHLLQTITPIFGLGNCYHGCILLSCYLTSETVMRLYEYKHINTSPLKHCYRVKIRTE